MDFIEIAGILAICCIISFIALHFWVFICDSIIGGIKRLFGFQKKKEINWHTLEKTVETKTDIETKKTESDINEKLY